jgi:hypothetical protein
MIQNRRRAMARALRNVNAVSAKSPPSPALSARMMT